MTSLANNLNIDFTGKDAFKPLEARRIRTKIICTIGPKTKDVESLANLSKAGMNVARLNFSHGDHSYHSEVIANVRKSTESSLRTCAIMLDTKGPEIRTGKLVNGEDIELMSGNDIKITSDYTHLGTTEMIAHSYPDMCNTVTEGSEILIDDGLISLTVRQILNDKEILCRINNGGELGNTKGVNLPSAEVKLPALTEKDKGDLKFGCEQQVDLVAASFIRKASDVEEIRAFLKEHGGEAIKIISKIENQEGLKNYDEILAVSDGIMVARGDLGVEIPTEFVATAQKMMISKCNVAGKPVVTATQMLDSMIRNPRPTRAEMTDVANAVFDGTDCVMLSGETAKGNYPTETVQTMVKICAAAEAKIDSRTLYKDIRSETNLKNMSVAETITSSAVKTAFDIDCAMILCLTQSGATARFVAKYRPDIPIVCVTPSEIVARQLLVHSGTFPMVIEAIFTSAGDLSRAMNKCVSAGLVKEGDFVCIIEGHRPGQAGDTNNMKVLKHPFVLAA